MHGDGNESRMMTSHTKIIGGVSRINSDISSGSCAYNWPLRYLYSSILPPMLKTAETREYETYFTELHNTNKDLTIVRIYIYIYSPRLEVLVIGCI